MNKKIYDWTRFLCPRASEYFIDDDGFLLNQDDPSYFKTAQPNLSVIQSHRESKCAVILGEPGIGKSTILAQEYEEHSEKENLTHVVFLYRNLNEYDSGTLLTNDIFKSEEYLKWLNSDKILYLYLDSLDEAILKTTVIAQILVRHLRSAPINRLRFKISCRTGVWPQYLENQLLQIFDSKINFLELVILRQNDVEIACSANGIDGKDFVSSVIDKGVVPFATKPNTLNFLIMLYLENKELPNSQLELYRKGCELHCKELNESREVSGLRGSLSPQERIKLASRISALMIFSNKTAIWTSQEVPPPENYLTYSEIIDEAPNSIELGIEVNRKNINEVLDTGLFVSRGRYLMGWSHQSYSEFLASQYLANHDVPLNQLKNLFFDGNFAFSKIVPNLQQTATWLSTQRDDFLNLVIQFDPEVLLRGDISYLSEVNKAKVVAGLITDLDAERSLVNYDFDLRKRYKLLKHDGLSEQLRPYLSPCSTSEFTKKFAVDLVEACNITELCDLIVNIALDKNEEHHQRVNAAVAIKRIGLDSHKKSLRPLLNEACIDDELKGCALNSLWPNHLTLDELLQHLTKPTNEHHYGSYSSFLHKNFINNAKIEQLPQILNWAKEKVKEVKSHHKLSYTLDALTEKALKNVNNDTVFTELTYFVYEKLKNHQDVINKSSKKHLLSEFDDNTPLRKRMFEYLVYNLDVAEFHGSSIFSILSLIAGFDAQWLFELFNKQDEPLKRRKLAGLIRCTVDPTLEKNLSLIREWCEKSPEIKKEFQWHVGPIEIGSEDAIKMKEYYETEKQRKNRAKKEEVNWQQRVSDNLDFFFDKIEENTTNSFCGIFRTVCVDLKSGHYRVDKMNVQDGDGWKFLNKERIEKLLCYGKKYLEEYEIDEDKHINAGSYNVGVMSGLKFLRFLAQVDIESLKNLDKSIWEKWTLPLLFYPTFNHDDETHQTLFFESSVSAQTVFRESVKKIVMREASSNDGHILILDSLNLLMSLDFAQEIYTFVKSQDIPIKGYINILGKLLRFGVSSVEDELKQFLALPISENPEERNKTILAINCLMANSKSGAWDIIFPILTKDKEFGKEVFLNNKTISFGFERGEFLGKLNESDLAKFYVWLVETFPYEEDRHGGGWVGPKEEAEQLRSSALSSLIGRGTHEACDGIIYAISKLPQHKFLKTQLLEAQNRVRLTQWKSPSANGILNIVQDAEKRIVRNYEELVEVVVDSLKRFEHSLHCETPAIADLWNTDRVRPKNEDEYSDRVKRFLDNDLRKRGIIVNREVEIRRTPEGSETDIHINAITQTKTGSLDKLTVIVETKGCWHDELYSAMETQLAQKYLKDNQSKYGVYLVGNFLCDRWDEKDYRLKKSKNNDIESNIKTLQEQAGKLREQGYQITLFVMNTKFRH